MSLWCPRKIGIDDTAFGLPLLLTSGNILYPISILGGSFPPFLSLFLYYDVNIIVRPKAVTFIPIYLGHQTQLPYFSQITVPVSIQ